MSSSSNASLLPPPLSSSNSSRPPSLGGCFIFPSSLFSFSAFALTNILLLLPLCVLILHLGRRRWRRRRLASTAAAAAAASHSDVFTYHVVAMETVGILGCGLCCCGTFVHEPWFMRLGTSFISVTSTGQTLFHVLTCAERYLAVVHPITYLGLRNRGGVRLRNAAVGCVWLLFLGSFALTSLVSVFTPVPYLCFGVLCIAVVSFCCLAVLRALIRPGPGEGAAGRARVDPSKLRALHTIAAIMGALLLRLGGHLLVLAVYSSPAVSERIRCALLTSGVWFGLPSSLVLPLLFLHRAGKLRCCETHAEAGRGSEENL